jgi:hypothetical protein
MSLWGNIKGCILVPLEWIKTPKRLDLFKYFILSFRYNANRCYMLFHISLSIKADILHGHHKLVYIMVQNFYVWRTSGCKIDYCIMHPVHTEVIESISYLNDLCMSFFIWTSNNIWWRIHITDLHFQSSILHWNQYCWQFSGKYMNTQETQARVHTVRIFK